MCVRPDHGDHQPATATAAAAADEAGAPIVRSEPSQIANDDDVEDK